MSSRNRLAWAVLWRSKNTLDGYSEFLLGTPDHPTRTKLFESRREAREFVREEFGYIKERSGLRKEPHGWKMPMPVRVRISVERAR